MSDKKITEVIFSPGCFDDFEGTQEELDQLINDIKQMVDSGELFEQAQLLEDVDFELLPEEVKAKILAEADAMPRNNTLH